VQVQMDEITRHADDYASRAGGGKRGEGEFEDFSFKVEVPATSPVGRVPSRGGSSTRFPDSSSELPAPKGGGTPGTTPHNVLCALKGHTEQGACCQRSPRWGEVSWGGVTQGSAPLHPGLSPCAALRRGLALERRRGRRHPVPDRGSVAMHPGRPPQEHRRWRFQGSGADDNNPGRGQILGMAWTALIVAGLLEIGWAIGLKYTQGFTRLWPSVGTGVAMVLSFGLLSYALRTIPVGTGYAVWTGIGAAGTAILGMMFLGESREVLRMVCIGLIVAGVVGLRLVSKG
jgi:quaternary ammonium compound-resistance protein SugE